MRYVFITSNNVLTVQINYVLLYKLKLTKSSENKNKCLLEFDNLRYGFLILIFIIFGCNSILFV